MNLSIDAVHKDQRVGGYKTLNLLNANEDPSFLRESLFSAIGRRVLPVPKANPVRVVINGECWGVYCNSQQTNKDYLAEVVRQQEGRELEGAAELRGGASLLYRATTGAGTAASTKLRAASTTTPGGGWSNCAGSCRRATTNGCCASCRRSSTSTRQCGSWRSTTPCWMATAT